MHVAIRKREKMPMHSKRQSQVGTLLFDNAFTRILVEDFYYSNIFSTENPIKFPENTRINEHVIELERDKQLIFGSIYSLELVKLETLKTYIKTNLANGLVQPFKSPVRASILFDKKSDESLCFYVNYWGLNNITIKNQYLLPLMGKLLDRLGQVKRFT